MIKRKKVAVIYKSLPRYRWRFYELLRERLDELGIEFILIYGQPSPADAAKKDTVEPQLPWTLKIPNKIFRFRSYEVYWQPCLSLLKDVDLVIVEQASKLLVNYVLLVQHLLGLRRLAFWGHGKNFQAHGSRRVSEALKRFASRRVHWWFAYNELSAGVVKSLGFPEERISSVQNAIDTQRLTQIRRRITPEEVEGLKEKLGLKGENTCLYVGGMYPKKRLGFLLEACLLIREEVPDFEMIFIGSGTDKALVEGAAHRHDWVRYMGPKFGEEKVPYFALSKLFLMPGLVGLAVLDTFALETPLVTTAVPYHSPEIDYLEDGVNGVVVEETEDPAAFASAVVHLLRKEDLWARLVEGCRNSKGRYTVEEMVERFATGVLAALKRE